MNFNNKFSLTLDENETPFDTSAYHPASMKPIGSSVPPLSFVSTSDSEDNDEYSRNLAKSIALYGKKNDDEYDEYYIGHINKMFRGRIKAENIFNTYTEISNGKFNFNYLDDPKNKKSEIVDKVLHIREKINAGKITMKATKTLYEIDDVVIDSPSYSYIEEKDDKKFCKIYAINLRRLEIEKDDPGNMDKKLLLFLAVVNELMKIEFNYHEKTHALVQSFDTIEKMIGYIKKNAEEGCGKIRFEADTLKASCDKLVETLSDEKKEGMVNYKIKVPEIYDTNMNENGFYYDKSHIYYYMCMETVPDTRNTALQSIEECESVKPLISVIDSFLIMNGISHNDYSTKGNVFVDVKNMIIYIIDFGTSGDYVYNAGSVVNLSSDINSLNIICGSKVKRLQRKASELKKQEEPSFVIKKVTSKNKRRIPTQSDKQKGKSKTSLKKKNNTSKDNRTTPSKIPASHMSRMNQSQTHKGSRSIKPARASGGRITRGKKKYGRF